MKIGIIGVTGHIGYVIEGLKKANDIELIGLAPGSPGEDIDTLNQQLKSMEYSVKKYNDFRKMIDEIRPAVAVVACHFGDHARVILESIKRGIHVFAEKPIATTLSDLEKIKQAYQKSPSQLTAMFGLRYTPWFLTAHQFVKEGAIGEIRLMNAQKSYKLGQRGEHFKDRKIYGGTIPWVGSHAIDWLHWFSGEKFASVYASHSRNNNHEHGDLETTGLCHFTFTNEVYGSVNIDYLRPQQAPGHGDDRLRIAGTKGVIEVRNEKVYLINHEINGQRELPLRQGESIFHDFLEEIRGNDQCLVTADDAFVVTEACLKARESADNGRVVEF